MFIIGGLFAAYSTMDNLGNVTISSSGASWSIVAFIFVFMAGFAYSWGVAGTVYPAGESLYRYNVPTSMNYWCPFRTNSRHGFFAPFLNTTQKSFPCASAPRACPLLRVATGSLTLLSPLLLQSSSPKQRADCILRSACAA